MKVGLMHVCAAGWAITIALAACSDSPPNEPAPSSEEKPAFARASMTVDTWAKLDSRLRLRMLKGADAFGSRSLFVQTTDPEGTRRVVEEAGGQVGTIAGDVMTVRVPSDDTLRRITALSAVKLLEDGRTVRRKLDKAFPVTKVDKVHAGQAPLSQAFKGTGVVVGVIDYGIDGGHTAFKGTDGKTRIRAVWDQTREGHHPAGFSYGSECAESEIVAGKCGQADDTHGTHVAGIAAGGPVAGTPYVGVAPEADIVYVNLASNRETTTAICDAASYVFKKAAAMNEPAVVNMSLGEHSGPHDGTSLADRCLDNLTGPGKIIVASAGNEGAGTIHGGRDVPLVVHATATASEQPTILRWLPNSKAGEKVYVWTDANVDLSVRVGFEPAAGGKATYSPPINRAGPLQETMLKSGSVNVGPVSGSASESPAGPRSIEIALEDGNHDSQEAEQTWLLEITGNGRFDAFIDTTERGGFLASEQAPGVTADSSMTIGFPASAPKVLAVASFTSRTTWQAADGSEQTRTSLVTSSPLVIGAISEFSSRGPMRNASAAMKPDIAAPGEYLASALNSGATVKDKTDVVKAAPDGFIMHTGTSMASPFMAGIVALMLQRNPSLTVDDVRAVLDRTAVKPDGVGTFPNATWGRGKVDALAALTDERGVANDKDDEGTRKGDNGGGCQMSPGTRVPWTGLGAATFALAATLIVRRRRDMAR